MATPIESGRVPLAHLIPIILMHKLNDWILLWNLSREKWLW